MKREKRPSPRPEKSFATPPVHPGPVPHPLLLRALWIALVAWVLALLAMRVWTVR